MDKHEFRIIWMFLGCGIISGGLLIIVLPLLVETFSNSNEVFHGKKGLSFYQQAIVMVAVFQPVVVLLAGVVSMVKKSTEHIISSFAAIFLLLAFPVGTAIGAYYLWYRYSFSNSSRLA